MTSNEDARKLLREHRVEIALEDDRQPIEIAQTLGLLAIQPGVIDGAIEVRYNTVNE